nr:hypothetical protein [uncultured Prevotella sp.]
MDSKILAMLAKRPLTSSLLHLPPSDISLQTSAISPLTSYIFPLTSPAISPQTSDLFPRSSHTLGCF